MELKGKPSPALDALLEAAARNVRRESDPAGQDWGLNVRFPVVASES